MIKQLINNLIKNGGGTLHKGKLVKFENGYMVAIKDFEKVIKLDDHESIAQYIAIHSDKLIGFWVNENKLYLDVVQNITNYHMAILEGLKQNQKAIWDCEECKEIWLG